MREDTMTPTDTPVVVGVDGSPDSYAAVELGAWEANRRGLPLRLVHGVVPPVAYGPTFSAARLSGTELAQARGLLDDTATALTDRYRRLIVTQAAVVQGPAGLLVDESATASLVLVGSRGHRVLTRLLGGSVSGQVAAHAHTPVLIVRESDRVPGTGPVVVGVDGSPSAAAALAFAAEEADARDVPLIAVHALPRHPHDPDEARRQADRMLSAAVTGWTDKYPGLVLRHCVVDGVNPADSLREAAAGAGLLVVGCRGHGGFATLLLGSVSQSLAGNAPAPVAVVHTH
jgi:nucleotide-binding universal stress UspA family protein